MTLARYFRNDLLPYGAQRDIAQKLGVADSVVSRVVNGKGADLSPRTVRRIQVAVARRLRRPVHEVFPVAA